MWSKKSTAKDEVYQKLGFTDRTFSKTPIDDNDGPETLTFKTAKKTVAATVAPSTSSDHISYEKSVVILNTELDNRALLSKHFVNANSDTRFTVKATGTDCKLYAGTVDSNKKVLWAPASKLFNGKEREVYVKWLLGGITLVQGDSQETRDTSELRTRQEAETLIF